jgi:hypothetical protein
MINRKTLVWRDAATLVHRPPFHRCWDVLVVNPSRPTAPAAAARALSKANK